jgi:integrase
MARPPHIPKYCPHRVKLRGYSRFPDASAASGYRVVYWPGPLDSAESRAAYHAGIQLWLETGRVPGREPDPDGGAKVSELVVAFWRFVEAHGHYRKGGRPTSERRCLRSAFRALLAVAEFTPAAAVTLADMDRLRAHMAAKGWAEGTVAGYMVRARSLFRWAEGRGLVPRGHATTLVPAGGLCAARPKAGRVTAPRRPADPAAVGAAALLAGPPVCSMIWLQWLNGMRPAGVCFLRACDIDRTGDVWVYREPPDLAAKTGAETHHFGPRARAILTPYLAAAASPTARLFHPSRQPRMVRCGGFSPNYYAHVIAAVCRDNGLPHWSPHQLRHSHLTVVRKLYGIEAARVRGGHASIPMAELYAERDADLAKRVAREIG